MGCIAGTVAFAAALREKDPDRDLVIALLLGFMHALDYDHDVIRIGQGGCRLGEALEGYRWICRISFTYCAVRAFTYALSSSQYK